MGDPYGSGFDPATLGLPADFRLTNYSALCVCFCGAPSCFVLPRLRLLCPYAPPPPPFLPRSKG
jgi:hypothetical protein